LAAFILFRGTNLAYMYIYCRDQSGWTNAAEKEYENGTGFVN
jgi:hypothetical protein